jgi:hypothetical protein
MMRFMAHGTIENRTAVDGFLMGQRAQLHCVFETNRREKMMKELIAMFMTLCCSLVLSSCNIPSARRRFFTYPMKEILNDTFSEFIHHLNQHDAQAMLAMFSASAVEEQPLLLDEVDAMIAHFPDPVTITEAASGIGQSSSTTNGENRTKGIGNFSIESNGVRYYVFLSICTEDSANKEEVGIIELSIISVDNYHDSTLFGGDPERKKGINILE